MSDVIQRIVEAVSETMKSALGISLSDLLVQLGATLLLVVIVRVFLWKKITAYLTARRELVQSELDNAKKQNEEAKELKSQAHHEYAEIKRKAQTILDSAKSDASKEHQTIVEDARSEAKRIRQNAIQEIEVEKQNARTELQGEVVELAALMASKIIQSEVDVKKYQNLSVDQFEGTSGNE